MEAECNGRFGRLLNLPETIRPVVRATMERIGTVILLDMVCGTIQGELSFPDAVHVWARNGIVYRMTWVNS